MRYIGNKESIIEKIYAILQKNGVSGKSVFDFFAGTANVGKFFKANGFRVCSSDFLYFSYCLQKAYIENCSEPTFAALPLSSAQTGDLFSSPLETVVNYLNALDGVEGFIYKNYTPDGTKDLAKPRMYFTSENGKKIDAIRLQIEEWKHKKLINESEYFVLLACLVETIGFYANIAGVYAAFQKSWDARALKPFTLRAIRIFDSKQNNIVFNADSMSLLDAIDVDILYLDPPYNERQYAPNYHILETVARYDNPVLRGVTGMREYEAQKSRFCNAKTALEDLDKIAKRARYHFLVLSYNSEGIMPSEEIFKTLSKYGSVKQEQFEYARFKSNSNGSAKTKKTVFEQLYILEKEI